MFNNSKIIFREVLNIKKTNFKIKKKIKNLEVNFFSKKFQKIITQMAKIWMIVINNQEVTDKQI